MTEALGGVLARPMRAQLVRLPVCRDRRGKLTFLEGGRHVPFEIRRAYWVYDVPGGEQRGEGHAYRTLQELLVALSGSFDVVTEDAAGTQRFHLDRAYVGLYVPPRVWRRLENFSTNSACLVVASGTYSERDYIRDRAEFAQLTGSRNGLG